MVWLSLRISRVTLFCFSILFLFFVFQLAELDGKLRERFPQFAGKLPGKKIGGNLKPEFVEERRIALEKYLGVSVKKKAKKSLKHYTNKCKMNNKKSSRKQSPYVRAQIAREN